jgi:hypothetical protein
MFSLTNIRKVSLYTWLTLGSFLLLLGWRGSGCNENIRAIISEFTGLESGNSEHTKCPKLGNPSTKRRHSHSAGMLGQSSGETGRRSGLETELDFGEVKIRH